MTQLDDSKNTGNEELDKKLREIIWYELGDGLNATDVEECIGSIKRIYALVQDMVNLHANMKQDMYRLGLTSTPVASSAVQPPNTPLESKNEDEIDEILGMLRKEAHKDGFHAQSLLAYPNQSDRYMLPAKRQIQELIAKARIESYQKGYIDGGIGVMNGELPYKRQFVSKAELEALQTKEG
jgi:hypothetical protein